MMTATTSAVAVALDGSGPDFLIGHFQDQPLQCTPSPDLTTGIIAKLLTTLPSFLSFTLPKVFWFFGCSTFLFSPFNSCDWILSELFSYILLWKSLCPSEYWLDQPVWLLQPIRDFSSARCKIFSSLMQNISNGAASLSGLQLPAVTCRRKR